MACGRGRGEGFSAPSSDTRWPLARDHAARSRALSRTRAEQPGYSLRPCCAWCSRPSSATAPLEGALVGQRSVPEVQAVPPRGHEALPQGRALPDREVRDRAPQLPAGRARARADQAVGVPAPAAREAEGAALLRAAREAVPHLLRQGVP